MHELGRHGELTAHNFPSSRHSWAQLGTGFLMIHIHICPPASPGRQDSQAVQADRTLRQTVLSGSAGRQDSQAVQADMTLRQSRQTGL